LDIKTNLINKQYHYFGVFYFYYGGRTNSHSNPNRGGYRGPPQEVNEMCKTCKHYGFHKILNEWVCWRCAKTDENGDIIFPRQGARLATSEWSESCGPDGKYYEQKEV
jgi:hypothetical protein